MFTPIGSGGRRPGRRRRWPRVLAVLLVLAVVAAFGVGGYWWLFAGGGDGGSAGPATSPTPTCTTPEVELPRRLPKPADVKVEVLNGTSTSGLATDTADAFVLLGFDVVGFGNADAETEGVATVTYAKGDLPEAVVVASYLPGATLAPTSRRTGGVVTATLGAGFEDVATPAEARANVESVALPTPDPVCR